MNEPNAETPIPTAQDGYSEIKQCVRGNPGAALLAAIGAGLVIGLLVRGLRPAAPRHRVIQLLEDLQERVRDAAAPVVRKAAAMADEGAEVLRDRAQDGEAWIERCLKGSRRRLHKFFS